jgi:hypothetical protein
MADERSPSGAPILRHTKLAPASSTIEHADDERLSKHLASVFDGKSFVWHEIISDRVHIDVHVVAPSEQHPYWVLMTSGMSARPMNVPAGMPDREEFLHAELALALPADWPMGQEAFEDIRNFWPIKLLKQLARLPHDLDTWLGWGHSIPNGDPATPYAPGTQLSGAIIIPPIGLGMDLFVVPGSPLVHIFQVLPVTSSEMALKLRVGLDDMLEHLEETLPDVYGPIDPSRASA